MATVIVARNAAVVVARPMTWLPERTVWRLIHQAGHKQALMMAVCWLANTNMHLILTWSWNSGVKAPSDLFMYVRSVIFMHNFFPMLKLWVLINRKGALYCIRIIWRGTAKGSLKSRAMGGDYVLIYRIVGKENLLFNIYYIDETFWKVWKGFISIQLSTIIMGSPHTVDKIYH